MAKIFEDIDFTDFHEKFFEVLDYHDVSPLKFIEYIYYDAGDVDVFRADLHHVLSMIGDGDMGESLDCSFHWDSTDERYSGWDSIQDALFDIERELAQEEGYEDEFIF